MKKILMNIILPTHRSGSTTWKRTVQMRWKQLQGISWNCTCNGAQGQKWNKWPRWDLNVEKKMKKTIKWPFDISLKTNWDTSLLLQNHRDSANTTSSILKKFCPFMWSSLPPAQNLVRPDLTQPKWVSLCFCHPFARDSHLVMESSHAKINGLRRSRRRQAHD